MKRLRCLAAACLLALALPAAAAAKNDWVARSNDYAKPALKALADAAPELASSLGLPGYDSGVLDLKANNAERFRSALAAAKTQLEKRRAGEKDARLQQDLDIMIAAMQQQIESSQINEKYLLPYVDVGQTTFQGLFALLQDDVPAKRRAAALTRLKRYAGLESGYEPLTELAKQRYNEQAGKPGLLGPVKAQVERALASTPQYVRVCAISTPSTRSRARTRRWTRWKPNSRTTTSGSAAPCCRMHARTSACRRSCTRTICAMSAWISRRKR